MLREQLIRPDFCYRTLTVNRAHSTVSRLACAALVLASFALAMAPPAAESQEHEAPALESFQGTFVLAGDRREQEAMMEAIDRVVDQLNLFIREIARGELRRRIDAEERIRLTIFGEQDIAFAFDDWAVRGSLDGRVRRIRDPQGEPIRSSFRFQDGRLIERRVAAQGERVNVLTLSSDAQRLHMQVRISSDQLPDAIRYRLSYRRAD